LINAFRKYIQDRSPVGDCTDLSVLPKYFRIVPTNIARNHDEVILQHNEHVKNGYEGIMVKKISNGFTSETKQYKESLYKIGKCNHILKYKDFTDEEVIIINVVNSSKLNVRDVRGNIFDVPLVFILDDINIIGTQLTIRYQQLTNEGLPIFPIGIAVRNYE
jgi:DNA ligase-1